MKKILIILFFVGISNINFGQTNAPKEIEWLTLQEAYLRTQKEPRKTIIDVYTQWCGWCRVMDKETYTNPEIIDYLNKNFYMVKLDAETKEELMVGPTKYIFDEKTGTNQAAYALLQGKLSYPTTVFLDKDYNMIQPLPGYIDKKVFHQIITYVAGDYNKTETFDAYKTGTYLSVYKASISKL